MYPLLLMQMLERVDPTFQDLFYPKRFRCRLEKRVVSAIEEHSPAYFPTRKACRGNNWSFTIPESEPLYQPHNSSREILADWKKSVKGTIAENRAYDADHSWKRFVSICRKSPRLKPFLKVFTPLAQYLVLEESLWLKTDRDVVGLDVYFQSQLRALLAPSSPYRDADSKRLKFLEEKYIDIKKMNVSLKKRECI